MAPPADFPGDLLTQPAPVRLASFVAKVVAHPRLTDIHQALLGAIRQPAGAALILVFGPTGVGKTTLRRRIEKQLIEEAGPALANDPGRLAVVGLEAVAPESGQFNWKDYYLRALLAVGEPLITHKLDAAALGMHRDGAGRLMVRGGTATPALRRALEACLQQRRPAAVIVDEAQHLKKLASGRRLLDQMDTLKSLAALTGTVHVLVGTYELLSLANLSGQLSRRSVDLHFGRYRAEVAEDLRAFQSVLWTFQRHLPLEAEPDLVGRWDYLYERSLGCVGVLKEWLTRALALALEAGEATLSERRLEQAAASPRKLLSLAREIREGEAALPAAERERGELRALLGLAPEPAGPPGAGPEARPGGRAGRRVGERRPIRDPVGGTPATGATG